MKLLIGWLCIVLPVTTLVSVILGGLYQLGLWIPVLCVVLISGMLFLGSFLLSGKSFGEWIAED